MHVLLQRGVDDLGDVAVAREQIVETLVLLKLLRACRCFSTLPVDDRDLLLLTRSEGKAVEQITERIAVGAPDLLEMQEMTVGDTRRLVEGRIGTIPHDGIVGGERRTPATAVRRGLCCGSSDDVRVARTNDGVEAELLD